MEKILDVKLSKKQHKIAYSLYKNNKTTSCIHNLSDVERIPFYVIFTLALGLNFSLIEKPAKRTFYTKMKSNVRRLAWKVHFSLLGKDSSIDDFDKFLIGCKKRNGASKNLPELYEKIFPDPFVVENIYDDLMKKYDKENIFPPKMLITKCTTFLVHHNLIVKNADKNAGVCIIKRKWHDDEVYRQLLDLSTYIPSCQSEYDLQMNDYIDKIRHLKIKINDFPLQHLIIENHRPASFYILPKIHKQYETFPPGRPISSTCQTMNRNISALVDYILKPIMVQIPNVLLDTTHFLILLKNIKLEENTKYALVTYDVDSMYTNLQVKRCKDFCITAYESLGRTEDKIVSCNDLNKLLDFCLDISFVNFNGELFKQKKGIQMGNAASVSIANIAAYYELKSMFHDKPEIIFNVRFVDDGFMIINTNNIMDLDTWLRSTFQHDFLTFTTSYSYEKISFLDVMVSIEDRYINTSLYKKPMSKNMYLSFYSNHPKHLVKSLPFSQAIRIKRICSEASEYEREVNDMFSKFDNRGYPCKYLQECRNRIHNISRDNLLIPKSQWLVMNFKRYHPELLPENITEIDNAHTQNRQAFYVVIPYYANVKELHKVVNESIHKEISKCFIEEISALLNTWEIKLVYSNGRNLANVLNKRHSQNNS